MLFSRTSRRLDFPLTLRRRLNLRSSLETGDSPLLLDVSLSKDFSKDCIMFLTEGDASCDTRLRRGRLMMGLAEDASGITFFRESDWGVDEKRASCDGTNGVACP
jgi:hypothetical protein